MRNGVTSEPTPVPPRSRGRALTTFTAEGVAALPGPAWLQRRRAGAFEELGTLPMPTEKEEVWRYTPIDDLRLDDFCPILVRPTPDAHGPLGAAFRDGVGSDFPAASAIVTVVDGWTVAVERRGLPDGVVLGGPGDLDGTGPLGQALVGGDALVRLNDAFHPDAVVLEVPDRTVVEGPVVIVHWCSAERGAGDDRDGTPQGPAPASAVFPRTAVRLGRQSSAAVVEVVGGPPGDGRALVVPVTELVAGDGSELAYVGLQVLGGSAWHLARLAATAGRDARIRTFTVGLGGSYDRSRTDAVASGAGAATELRSAYLGTGDQVHDVRTLQDHAAPHTSSDLLCKGAVAGRSRSVYSGLIRVRRGAVRTEALQTNHNLVLDERAHADSVPNLDIEENDVRCSHASTVGPVDEDQRYYLESRGVPPGRAEQLIVLGFFDDIVDRSPVPAAVGRLRREVGLRLAGALALGEGSPGRVQEHHDG